MANFPINPEYNSDLRQLEPTDRAHADIFNVLFQQLINNDVFLKKITDENEEDTQKSLDDFQKSLESYGFQDFLTKNSIGDTLDYHDLIASQKPVFFTNWHDNTNFPDLYGSGILIPGLDPTNKYIIYILGSNIYTKRLTSGQDHGWKKLLNPDDLVNRKYFAAQGEFGGYSFSGENGNDTGLFSDFDGDLYFLRNGGKITLPQSGEIPNKEDLTTAINELKKSVSDGKTQVAAAITEKGQATAADASFSVLAENIRSIKMGHGNAWEPEVLAGRTFSNADGVERTGTMPYQGAIKRTIPSGGSFAIPEGYHDGNGVISVERSPMEHEIYDLATTEWGNYECMLDSSKKIIGIVVTVTASYSGEGSFYAIYYFGAQNYSYGDIDSFTVNYNINTHIVDIRAGGDMGSSKVYVEAYYLNVSN